MNDRNMKQSEGVGWTDEEAVELEGMILVRFRPSPLICRDQTIDFSHMTCTGEDSTTVVSVAIDSSHTHRQCDVACNDFTTSQTEARE